MAIKISILFTSLTIFSCNAPQPLTENEKAAIVEEIQHTMEDYTNAVRRSGLTAEFPYLDNSADFYWTPPGYRNCISYDSVAAILNQNAKNFLVIDNSIDTIKITPLNKEYAVYAARLTSRVTDISQKTTTLSLVETGVLVKRKDGWKLLNGQTSILN